MRLCENIPQAFAPKRIKNFRTLERPNFRTSPLPLTTFSLLLTTSLLALAHVHAEPFGWLTHNAPVPAIDINNPQTPPASTFSPVVTNAPGGIMPLTSPAPTPPDTFTLDLPETIPASDFARIKELARGLDYDWEKCYRFVRDNIAYAPYFGILRGPDRTLLDREGNDADQAFLLLALLRASGHTATVSHVNFTTGVFSIPMYNHDGNTPHNAADWLGLPATGTFQDILDRIALKLARAGRAVNIEYRAGAFRILTDHAWVALDLGGVTHHLDPSFKPALRTPGRDTPADMAYSRAALISAAGGSTDANSVLGVSAANLETHLNARAAALYAAWTNDNATAAAFIGETTVIPQDPADTTRFRGEVFGTVNDFLAQSDPNKNAYRASMTLQYGTITKQVFLDEIGARSLWVSYTAAAPFPRATLRLDDTALAAEPSGAAARTGTLSLSIAYTPASMSATPYTLTRDTAYVYAIPVGFGGDAPGGMRAWAAEELAKANASGLAKNSPQVLARALQATGHQWLAQVAMTQATYNRAAEISVWHFYSIGLAAQERAPYVDMKNACVYSTGTAVNFDGRTLFLSALEHAVLDQLNGTNAPAVSTVKAIEMNNAAGNRTYFANAANYSSIRPLLTGYPTPQLDAFANDASLGRTLLLPRNGSLTLNQWTGFGFIRHGPLSPGSITYITTMGISGNLNGGFGSKIFITTPWDFLDDFMFPDLSWNGAIGEITAGDPVAMPSGAFTDAATDLISHGIRPLAFTRSYDSRARHTPGPLGRGWSHNYDASTRLIADPDAVMAARGSIAAVIPTAVAAAIVEDMLAEQGAALTPGENARRWVIASLTIQWWLKQLVGATVSVNTGAKSLTFHKRTDGAYAPYPGITATLTNAAASGLLLSERLGNTYAFNAAGRLTAITSPDGNTVNLAYTAGNLTSVTDATHGNALTLAWSGGRITSVANNAGHAVSYAYGPTHCLTNVTDATSKKWAIAYDPATHALTSKKDPLGHTAILNAYNTLGQVTNQVTALGHPWAFGYAAGTLAWDENPLRDRQTFHYDPTGRLLQRTAYDGLTTAHTYDPLGRLTASIRPSGATDSFAYDGLGNNTVYTNSEGNVYSMSYDALGRITAATNALGIQAFRNGYDNNGNVTNRLDANGNTVSYGYDALNRMTSKVAQTSLSAYSYDTVGNMLTASNATATLTFSYDSVNLLTNAVTKVATASLPLTFTTHWLRDPGGLVTNFVYATGQNVAYTHDHNGHISAVTDWLGNEWTFTRDNAGRTVATASLPVGGPSVNSTYAYDTAGRLSSLQVANIAGRAIDGYGSMMLTNGLWYIDDRLWDKFDKPKHLLPNKKGWTIDSQGNVK